MGGKGLLGLVKSTAAVLLSVVGFPVVNAAITHIPVQPQISAHLIDRQSHMNAAVYLSLRCPSSSKSCQAHQKKSKDQHDKARCGTFVTLCFGNLITEPGNMELRGLAGGMRHRNILQDERERQPDLLNKVLKFFVVSFVSA
jgi:hypothetical protein